jgi:hypothetical protein
MLRKSMVTLGLPLIVVGALAGCETSARTDGAVLGGALGAGLGAIVGHQSGHQGEGALIGAGAGALVGAIAGDQVEQSRQRTGYYAQPPAPRYGSRYRSAPPPRGPGHWELRRVTTPSGETYEERVWVPHY